MSKGTLWFLLLLSLVCSQFAEAQQALKLPRIGLLSPVAPPPAGFLTALDQRLRQLGYVDGKNINIERRYANGQMNRLPELAADLVRLPVDVILAQSFPAALAAIG
jgi:putative ABC transport system substrate-binding protein